MPASASASAPRAGAGAAVARAATLGRSLVVVPHPDDETLGCGGLLALLAAAGAPVLVVLVSDGAASHPQSAAYPGPRLAALRLRELHDALAALGLHAAEVWPMGLADGAVPSPAVLSPAVPSNAVLLPAEPAAFAASVERLFERALAFRPDTVLLPWRHDDHPDHRASHALATAACDRAAPRSRRLEYRVWVPPHVRPADRFDGEHWSIAVDSVLERKRRALAAHRSQLGQVVVDDPAGFVLPAHLVAACAQPTETYFDTTAWSPR